MQNDKSGSAGRDGEAGSVGRGSEAGSAGLVPPDGGWGWCIVVASALIQAVLSTMTICFGLVYVHLVSSGYTNTQVAPLPGLFYGLSCLMGPITTSLTRYYSHRRLGMVGLGMVVLALVLCTAWDSLPWIYLCYGVIGGCGYGLATPLGFMLGQAYFQQRRVTANALSMLGASVGAMAMPPILSFLVGHFSMHGAFLLWAAIVLHGLVGAMLFHPVEWHLVPRRVTPLEVQVQITREPELDTSDNESEDDAEEHTAMSELERAEVMELKKRGYDLSAVHKRMRHDSVRSGSFRSFRDSLYSNYDVMGSALSVMDPPVCLTNAPPAQDTKDPPAPPPLVLCGIKLPRFSEILSFDILKNPFFLIASTSSIANRMVFMNFVTFLPSVSAAMGVGGQAAYLLTAWACADLLSKLVMAAISDCGWCERRYFAIAACACASFCGFMVPQCRGLVSLGACCVGYGFSAGMLASVSPVLLVEYLGFRQLAKSFGFLLFMNGLSSFIIFPLTGWLSDVMADYRVVYYVLGCLALVPAVLWNFASCFPHTPDNTPTAR